MLEKMLPVRERIKSKCGSQFPQTLYIAITLAGKGQTISYSESYCKREIMNGIGLFTESHDFLMNFKSKRGEMI